MIYSHQLYSLGKLYHQEPSRRRGCATWDIWRKSTSGRDRRSRDVGCG
jgi:hypothetical protein